jgi:hypothetical protein
MTPITMALKDEVALIEEAVWIEDNMFVERPLLRCFTEIAIFLLLLKYPDH